MPKRVPKPETIQAERYIVVQTNRKRGIVAKLRQPDCLALGNPRADLYDAVTKSVLVQKARQAVNALRAGDSLD